MQWVSEAYDAEAFDAEQIYCLRVSRDLMSRASNCFRQCAVVQDAFHRDTSRGEIERHRNIEIAHVGLLRSRGHVGASGRGRSSQQEKLLGPLTFQ